MSRASVDALGIQDEEEEDEELKEYGTGILAWARDSSSMGTSGAVLGVPEEVAPVVVLAGKGEEEGAVGRGRGDRNSVRLCCLHPD